MEIVWSNAPSQNTVSQSRLLRAVSHQILNISKNRFQNLSGQPVPTFNHLLKKVFSYVQMASPVFLFMPISHFPHSHHQVFILIRPLLQANSLSSFSLSLYVGCSKTFILLVVLHCTCSNMPMSLLHWGTLKQAQQFRM